MALMTPAESGEFIVSHCEHVSIDSHQVEQLAAMLNERTLVGDYSVHKWKSDNPLHPQSMVPATTDWIFLVDSLNFSFWPDAGHEFSIEGEVGYWALCAAVNRALREGFPFTDPAFYSHLSMEQARQIFRTDQPSVSIPMLQERVDILQQNGRTLVEHFGSSFANCIEQADSSAVKLLNMVCKYFPSFGDQCQYRGKTVTFYKRAQILIADIWACFEGKHLGTFVDIDRLTMFADYRIPQVLHYFGVLRYSATLERTLRESSLLENGSQLEVEIRGASIHVIELVKEKMRATWSHTEVPNSIQIDFFLWGYRREHAEQIDLKSPYHRVRCIFY